jgi:flavin-dependent thymidylate synthase
MNVSLIDYTGKGSPDPARHAANTMIFTKSTRLNMRPELIEVIAGWPEDMIRTELEYMANTIPSSWEFCHYTLLITGVSRAFTHQLVRTRTASFAQQTMRVLDVSGWDYVTGPTIGEDTERTSIYADAMGQIDDTYQLLIEKGAKIEDARGILPTNIKTNIVLGINLRNLTDMLRKRASSRTQGEYRDVMAAVRVAVVGVHPFADLFFRRTFDNAAGELEDLILSKGDDELTPTERVAKMIKLLDQMRSTA